MKGKDLKLSFGNEIIFDNANFEIKSGSKVGIVGVNGAGKTTLFNVILNNQELDGGKITIDKESIAYLPQEIDLDNLNMSVIDYIFSARPIKELHDELNNIYENIQNSHPEEEKRLLKKAARLQEKLDILNEYTAEDELLELLSNMEIPEDLWERKVSTLSGGQKSKIAFAHLLFTNATVLLLDEPTNHLDMQTKGFITDYLKNYRGTILVISHDIDFLNEIIDKVLFIDKVTHKINIYDGNYHTFKKAYAREKAQKEARIEEQERTIKKLEEIVKRANEASRTNHNLKRLGASRQKELNKRLEALETRDKIYKKVILKVEPKRVIGKVPIEVTGLTFGYDKNHHLYENLSFTLSKNEKFLIVGENGIGKSTLLKLLMGKLTPYKGTIEYSSKADIAYYAQELEILDENKTILENISSADYSSQELRNHLGNFLFYGNDVKKIVKVLSPGEKARVALCKILLKRANLIILDEPTNHFDPETQKIIGENFKDYPGTLILVSHNPSFVKEIGITRMLLLPDGKILNYSEDLLHYFYYLNTDLV